MPEPIYKTTDQIFYDSPKFVVPIYQREYTWQPIQIDQLLNDISYIEIEYTGKDEITQKYNHFLGLLVFIDDKNEDGEPLYNLVDGQQRLSTIILIAAVAKDIITAKLNDPEIKQAETKLLSELLPLFDNYIYRKSRPRGKKSPRLEPNNNDMALFNLLVLVEDTFEKKRQKVIDELGKAFLRKKYFKAYQHVHEYLIEKINELGVEFLEGFFVRIDAGVTFIPFIAESDTDAFNLFETLNDRGLNLSALDLIKNKVLQKTERDDIEKIDAAWQEIFGKEGIIPSRQSQVFLRNFLMIKNGHITNNRVYDVCKSILISPEAVQEFLSELRVFSGYYRSISVVSEVVSGKVVRYVEDDDIAELLFLLNKTKVKQWQSVA